MGIALIITAVLIGSHAIRFLSATSLLGDTSPRIRLFVVLLLFPTIMGALAVLFSTITSYKLPAEDYNFALFIGLLTVLMPLLLVVIDDAFPSLGLIRYQGNTIVYGSGALATIIRYCPVILGLLGGPVAQFGNGIPIIGMVGRAVRKIGVMVGGYAGTLNVLRYLPSRIQTTFDNSPLR